MTNKVEKGQKYKGEVSGHVFEIMTDLFEAADGREYFSFWDHTSEYAGVSPVEHWDSFALIREPKFKVGDKVKAYSSTYKIVAVSTEADYEGEFSYIIKDDGRGEHDHTFESRLKAAE